MTMHHDAAGLRPGGGPVALVPRINIQAFCEMPETAERVRAAFSDRRMARAHGTVIMGGIPAAVRLYQTQSSPNLLVLESAAPRDVLLGDLASLAEVCQPETKVIIVGHVNDVILYRDLIRQGVSEYIVAPIGPLQLVEAIASIYRSDNTAPVGRVIAFMGVKGGTGSSTIAQNCAWQIARSSDVETTLVDLDIAYGTGALNFNIDAAGGVQEAVTQPERVDTLLLDRLLVKLDDKLSLLGGPGGVEKELNIEPHAVETVLGAMRATVPMIIVDVPNVWAPWVRSTLLHADQIILTAEPELASLRNAKSLVDMLKAARPNDAPPTIVLNKVSMPKRPEIPAADFSKAVGATIVGAVPFDPLSFGNALNNGRMLLDFVPRSKAADVLRRLAASLAGEKPARPPAGNSLLKKLLVIGKK